MTNWHQVLGTLLELLLTPLDVTVQTEVMVMSEPPRSDILLLRRNSLHWTEEQRRYLPDGIRDTDATHVLIEFKATESVTADGVLKIAAYDLFYRESQKLTKADVAVFLVSSKHPRKNRLDELGFVPTDVAGIYDNTTSVTKRVQLISLNNITSDLHNAFVKTFSSKKSSQKSAIETLRQREIIYLLRQEIALFLAAWWKHWSEVLTGEKMQLDLAQDVTFEQLVEEGKEWFDVFLSVAPIEKRIEGIPVEDIVNRISVEDRLRGIPTADIIKEVPFEEIAKEVPVEERLRGIPTAEIVKGVPVEDRLRGIPPADIVKDVPAEDRLDGLSAETIQAYLDKLKQAEADQSDPLE